MKVIIPIAILSGALFGVNQLHALEKWEGSDSFDNSQRWSPFVDRGDYGKIVNTGGRLIYLCSQGGRERNGAAWLWGNSKKAITVPTIRSWEVGCEITMPENSPTPNLSEAGVTVGVSSPGRPGYARAVYCGIKGSYDGLNRLDGAIQVFSDYNFEQRPRWDGGEPDQTETVQTINRTFIVSFRHNALTRKDQFELKNSPTGLAIYQREGNSDLFISPWVNFWLAMGIEPYKSWPGFSNNIAVDNWYLRAFDPDPINLDTKSGSGNGLVYSVAITNLGMTASKLTGTVALTVGSASASLPITGSIDKNGWFALTAKGAGANRGFGCVLLYDVATGTYRPNKNTVTAPNQKAIKF
jgi:hypothetical protein